MTRLPFLIPRPVPIVRSFLASLLLLVALGEAGAQTALVATPPKMRVAPPGGYILGGGDLNGDGLRDVMIIHAERAFVHLSRGDGTFLPAVDTRIARKPGVEVTIANLDNDGRADAVTQTGREVGLFYGRGDGTFTPGGSVSLPDSYMPLAFGDFTGDGAPDLVSAAYVAAQQRTVFFVLPNLGNGAFGTAVVTQMAEPAHIATMGVADFDRDGRLDVVAATAWASWVAHGTGDGRFRDFPRVAAGAHSLAVADFDSDGRPDWAAGSTGNAIESVSVFLNQTDGTFSRHALRMPGTSSVRAEDMNGDGVPDIVASLWSGHVGILVSRNDGTFAPPRLFAGAKGTMDVGRYDRDAAPDVVSFHRNRVTFARGRGDGTLDLLPAYITDAAPHIDQYRPGGFRFRFADVTGDAAPDAVAVVGTDQGSYEIVVLANDGHGALGLPVHTPTGIASDGHPQVFALADFTGDGRADVAIGRYGILIFAGRDDGTFEAPVESNASSLLSEAAEMTGDGRIDLIYVEGSWLSVFANTGGGTFVERFATRNLHRQAVGHAVIDVDGDADLDIIAASDLVLLNSGDGNFTSAATRSSRYEAIVAAGDFDEDGSPDLLTQSLHLELHRGTGRGTFEPPVVVLRTDHRHLRHRTMSANAIVADVDGDRHLDVVAKSLPGYGADDEVTILLGDGRGGFRNGEIVDVANSVSAIDVADLDGNGTLDVGVAERYSGLLDVLMTYQVPLGDARVNVHLSGPAPAVRHGQPRLYTIDVSSTSPHVADGTVRLASGDRTVAIARPDENGRASIQLPLEAGPQELTAHYEGDATFAAASSNTLRYDVAKARLDLKFVARQHVKRERYIDVELSFAADGGTVMEYPTGDVVITVSGRRSYTTTRPAHDMAGSLASFHEIGTYHLTADYAGDANFEPAHAEYTVVVHPTPPSVFLTVRPRGPVQFGAPVTMAAFIMPAASGTVTFYAGERWLGTAPVVEGVATFTTAAIYPGTQLISAAFAGGDTAGPRRSFLVPLTVIGAPPLQKRRAAR
ncbi:MAG TPA: FG-GAP-like repeat-containing protein [Thermoanaerobaculia bacterium]|nr:FG-GAP-like repeat-containing protein [Thermoanaerobaculia bacterium]